MVNYFIYYSLFLIIINLNQSNPITIHFPCSRILFHINYIFYLSRMEHIVKDSLASFPSSSALNMNYRVLWTVVSLRHVHFVVDYYCVLINESCNTNQIIVNGLSRVKTYREAMVSLPLPLQHLDTFQWE